MKYSKLRIAALDQRLHANTCGYWYTVTDSGTAHTAFRTRVAALAWLAALGLSIEGELEQVGTHGTHVIIGEYRRECVMCSEESFADLPGLPVAVLENGSFRSGKLTEIDGLRVLYSSNANNKWDTPSDYKMCSKMQNEGMTVM